MNSISCAGESCSAVGVVWGFTPGEPVTSQMPDSCFLWHSTDGGQTWLPSGMVLPQWAYTWNSKEHTGFTDIDQIDSLDAIVAGSVFISTFDGWKTGRTDSSFPLTLALNGDTGSWLFGASDFVNAAEGEVGALGASYGSIFYTNDSGNHWLQRKSDADASHSYGEGMFRELILSGTFFTTRVQPDTLLTTHDKWLSVDTSLITLNGPFLDTSVHVASFLFGGGDTLAILGFRWHKSDVFRSTILLRSTDLGANWVELPIPPNNIYPATSTPQIASQTIVIAGEDRTEEIILSTDRGATWQVDTVALANGQTYHSIDEVVATGSGRVLASIRSDSKLALPNDQYEGSGDFLAYLEPVSSGVRTRSQRDVFTLSLYPNPASNILNIELANGTISISDPLGRNYTVPKSGTTLDISSLPSGVYFVSDGVSRAKFVKE